MARAKPGFTVERLAAYDRLVASLPGVERKGKGTPYTSGNGIMCSFLTTEGTLALRLPEGEREALIRKHGARPCFQHGRPMRDFVEIPDSLWRRLPILERALAASHAYAASLPPKGGKKAASKGKAKEAGRKGRP